MLHTALPATVCPRRLLFGGRSKVLRGVRVQVRRRLGRVGLGAVRAQWIQGSPAASMGMLAGVSVLG